MTPVWGVKHSYVAKYDDKETAEQYAESYGGVLVVSEDGGETWEEAA